MASFSSTQQQKPPIASFKSKPKLDFIKSQSKPKTSAYPLTSRNLSEAKQSWGVPPYKTPTNTNTTRNGATTKTGTTETHLL